MSRHIFLVIGSEYESSAVLGAFEAKRDAEAFRDRCGAYESGDRPHIPDPGNTPESEAAFDKAWAKHQRWEKRHPGGKYAHGFDNFGIQRIRLHEPSRSLPAATGTPPPHSSDEPTNPTPPNQLGEVIR